MKILMVEPGIIPYEKELDSLADMQAAVGGYIEAIYPFSEQVAVVCNDEGFINGLPFNRSVPGGYGGVFGPFFVCGMGAEDFCSLTPEQLKTYKQRFQKAEILLSAKGNDLTTLKVQAKSKNGSPPKKSQDVPQGRD